VEEACPLEQVISQDDIATQPTYEPPLKHPRIEFAAAAAKRSPDAEADVLESKRACMHRAAAATSPPPAAEPPSNGNDAIKPAPVPTHGAQDAAAEQSPPRAAELPSSGNDATEPAPAPTQGAQDAAAAQSPPPAAALPSNSKEATKPAPVPIDGDRDADGEAAASSPHPADELPSTSNDATKPALTPTQGAQDAAAVSSPPPAAELPSSSNGVTVPAPVPTQGAEDAAAASSPPPADALPSSSNGATGPAPVPTQVVQDAAVVGGSEPGGAAAMQSEPAAAPTPQELQEAAIPNDDGIAARVGQGAIDVVQHPDGYLCLKDKYDFYTQKFLQQLSTSFEILPTHISGIGEDPMGQVHYSVVQMPDHTGVDAKFAVYWQGEWPDASKPEPNPNPDGKANDSMVVSKGMMDFLSGTIWKNNSLTSTESMGIYLAHPLSENVLNRTLVGRQHGSHTTCEMCAHIVSSEWLGQSIKGWTHVHPPWSRSRQFF
jgi:hypothetical protein